MMEELLIGDDVRAAEGRARRSEPHGISAYRDGARHWARADYCYHATRHMVALMAILSSMLMKFIEMMLDDKIQIGAFSPASLLR